MKEVQAQRVQQLHQTLPLESNLYSSSKRLANIRGGEGEGEGEEKRIGEERGIERGRR